MEIELIHDACMFKENSLLITFNIFGGNNVVKIDYDIENFKKEISSNLAQKGDEFEFIVSNFKNILESNKNFKIRYNKDINRIEFIDHLGIPYHFKILHKRTMIVFNIYININGKIIIDLEPSRYENIINNLSNNIKELHGMVVDEDYVDDLMNLLKITKINKGK